MKYRKIIFCFVMGISSSAINAQEINFNPLPAAATPGLGELVYSATNDRLFIASGANVIRVVDDLGNLDTSFATDGIFGNDLSEETLLDVEYIAISGSRVFVSDQERKQVLILNSGSGALDATLAGDGIIGNDAAEPNFVSTSVHDIEILDNQLYIATNLNIIRYALDGSGSHSVFSTFPAQTLSLGPLASTGICSSNPIFNNQLLYAIAPNSLNNNQGTISCIDSTGTHFPLLQTGDISITDLTFATSSGSNCGNLTRFSDNTIGYIASRRIDTELQCFGANGSRGIINNVNIGASTGITTTDNRLFIREVGSIGHIYKSDILNQVPIVTPQSLSINENLATNTLVLTVQATELDPGPPVFINWTIQSGNDSVDGDADLPFAINSSTGAITVNDSGDIDRELIAVFYLMVTVSDGISDSAPATIEISLNDINEFIPEIIAIGPLSILENITNNQSIITATATDLDATSVLQDWMIISGNNSLDGDANLPFAIDTNSGDITINDEGDINLDLTNSYSLMLSVSDGLFTSNPVPLIINITDVNDAPFYDPGANQYVAANDSGTKIIPSWATNISAGAAHENGQIVQFIVTPTSDPNMIINSISIAANGTLTYDLSANTGVATVDVILMDDGGVLFGGINQTSPFELTIVKENGVDLVANMTDNRLTIENGELIEYTITVKNNGLVAAPNANVNSTLDLQLINPTWTCFATGGSSCNPNGSGTINESVNLAVNGRVTFILTATVNSASGTIVSSVTGFPFVIADEIIPADNTSTDMTIIGEEVFKDSFETAIIN